MGILEAKKKCQMKEAETEGDRIQRSVLRPNGQTKQPHSPEFISELTYIQKQDKVWHRRSVSI